MTAILAPTRNFRRSTLKSMDEPPVERPMLRDFRPIITDGQTYTPFAATAPERVSGAIRGCRAKGRGERRWWARANQERFFGRRCKKSPANHAGGSDLRMTRCAVSESEEAESRSGAEQR